MPKGEEEVMARTETFFDWGANLLGIAGGIPAIAERLGKIWRHIPEPLQEKIKQRMPGFLGLSLDDERIFNGLRAKLDIEKQKLLTNFLYGKCKDFQRNRFINIVAGMEIVAGVPTIVERKWNKIAKKFEDKKIAGKDTEDLRLNFLDKFADYIGRYGTNRAFEYCVGGRMVLENPFHQKVITAWKDSVTWFGSLLSEIGASPLTDIGITEQIKNNTADLTNQIDSFKNWAKNWRDAGRN